MKPIQNQIIPKTQIENSIMKPISTANSKNTLTHNQIHSKISFFLNQIEALNP